MLRFHRAVRCVPDKCIASKQQPKDPRYDHIHGPPMDDGYEPEPAASKSSERIRETLLSIQQSVREAEDAEGRIAVARNRIITFRAPHDLMDRLDTVAETRIALVAT